MSNGVLYIAVGEAFVQEAVQSAQSVREVMDGISITLATDGHSEAHSVFDSIVRMDGPQRTEHNGREWLIDSTIPADLSPYDRTLYLDSDTYVCADVSELFGLLDDFDIAVASHPNKPRIESLPAPWHELNCGVIAYRDSSATRSLLRDWDRRYRDRLEAQDNPKDQPAFAEALYHSDAVWYRLPREYNVRYPRRGALAGEATIVHGRHRQGLGAVAAALNQHEDRLRIWRATSYLSTPAAVVPHNRYRYHLERTLLEDGVRRTIAKAVAHLSDRYLGTQLWDAWITRP